MLLRMPVRSGLRRRPAAKRARRRPISLPYLIPASLARPGSGLSAEQASPPGSDDMRDRGDPVRIGLGAPVTWSWIPGAVFLPFGSSHLGHSQALGGDRGFHVPSLHWVTPHPMQIKAFDVPRHLSAFSTPKV